MINYLIVDDEPQARKLLHTYLSAWNNFHLVKLCASAMEAYEALHSNKVDLMFLDIKMPVVSGIDFMRSLKNPPLVIFTTAYPKYAIEGYELNVIDYLLKPIAMPRLLQAIEKVQAFHFNKQTAAFSAPIDHIFIKADNKLVKVVLAEILLIEGLQNYVKVHLQDRVLVAGYTMKSLLNMLPEKQFLRVHRSFIVPVNTIIAIDGNTIETAYRNVPVGSSFKEQIRALGG